MRPTNSRGWPAIAAASLPAPSNAAACLREDRLGTFLHLNVCGHCNAPSTLGDKLDEIACAGPAPAFERQPDRHALPLADPALDRNVAPMQMRQALDDRQTKPRAVAAMFTGGTRLEESFSQTRQIVFIDSDSDIIRIVGKTGN